MLLPTRLWCRTALCLSRAPGAEQITQEVNATPTPGWRFRECRTDGCRTGIEICPVLSSHSSPAGSKGKLWPSNLSVSSPRYVSFVRYSWTRPQNAGSKMHVPFACCVYPEETTSTLPVSLVSNLPNLANKERKKWIFVVLEIWKFLKHPTTVLVHVEKSV